MQLSTPLFRQLDEGKGVDDTREHAVDTATGGDAGRHLATQLRVAAAHAQLHGGRQHAAAIIQGYRTRDFAFRAFRDEALER